MLNTTLDLIKASLKCDPTITPEDRTRLMLYLRHNRWKESKPSPATPAVPRILRRAEAASRMGVSLRTLDNWAKTGILSRVYLPGRIRRAGFREADINNLIQG